jgi:hypothetical protein
MAHQQRMYKQYIYNSVTLTDIIICFSLQRYNYSQLSFKITYQVCLINLFLTNKNLYQTQRVKASASKLIS